MNYWFRTKKYGYGWVPASWQGWLVLALYVALSFCFFVLIDAHSHSEQDAFLFFVPCFLVLSVTLLVVVYKTGEKPRWR